MPDLNEAQERADLQAIFESPKDGLERAFKREVLDAGSQPHEWDDATVKSATTFYRIFAMGYQASAQQVEAVSIDSSIAYNSQFQALTINYANAYMGVGGTSTERAFDKLAAFIDTKLRQAATGSADGLDAKRYRLLRDEAIYQQEDAYGWYEVKIDVPLQEDVDVTPEQFDAAIDAAILAQQEQRHE